MDGAAGGLMFGVDSTVKTELTGVVSFAASTGAAVTLSGAVDVAGPSATAPDWLASGVSVEGLTSPSLGFWVFLSSAGPSSIS